MGVPSASTSKREGGREEWMMELPEVKKVTDLGLGARQFRASEGPDFSDRSSWTDTPNTVKKTVPKVEDLQGRMASIQERERDKAMEKMKRKHEKKHKRDKSLLELHEKKLKKKKVGGNNKLIFESVTIHSPFRRSTRTRNLSGNLSPGRPTWL